MKASEKTGSAATPPVNELSASSKNRDYLIIPTIQNAKV
jgi:hypothetical protein